MSTLSNTLKFSNRNPTGSLCRTTATPGHTYSKFHTFRRIQRETIRCTTLTPDRLAPPPSASHDPSHPSNSTIPNNALPICQRLERPEGSHVPVHLSLIQLQSRPPRWCVYH